MDVAAQKHATNEIAAKNLFTGAKGLFAASGKPAHIALENAAHGGQR